MTPNEEFIQLLKDHAAETEAVAPPAAAPDTSDPNGDKAKFIQLLKDHAAETAPVEQSTVATPKSLDYIVGLAKRGAANFGNNLSAGASAELGTMPGQLPPSPESLKVPTQAEANQELFGKPQVVAPDAPSRYLGAVAEGFTSNPILGAAMPAATIGSSIGAQGGSDLFPNSRIAPLVGGVIGGLVPSAVIGPTARTAESLLAGMPSGGAMDAFDLANMYGVNLRATQVPGASANITRANNALQYVPFAGTGREVQPVVDQFHQALNRAIGGDPSSKTITAQALSDAARRNGHFINAAERQPFNLNAVGDEIMPVVQNAGSAMTPVEQQMLPKIIGDLRGAIDYRDVFNKLDNLGSVTTSPAVKNVIGQIRSKVQDYLGKSMRGENEYSPSDYEVALERQQNLDVVKNIPRSNGQVNTDQFPAHVNALSSGPRRTLYNMDALSDLSKISENLNIKPQPFSTATRHIIEPLAGAVETGMALAGHHPGLAGLATATPVVTGAIMRRFQNYLSSPQMARRLQDKYGRMMDRNSTTFDEDGNEIANPSSSYIAPSGPKSASGAGVGLLNYLQGH